MTLRELQYLVELARLGNFHRAAEVCGVSQPTLSTQIRKLEERLGLTLVERSARQTILTPAGEEIATRAREILNGVQDIHDIAARNRQGGPGRLCLGVFPTLGPYILPALVPRIASRFPGVQLQLVEEKSELLQDRLHGGQLDAALLALPIHDGGLQVERLFDEPFLLAVPPAHPLAGRESVSVDDLAEQRLMLLEDGHCLRDQALSLCHQSGNAAPDGGGGRRYHPAARAGDARAAGGNRQPAHHPLCRPAPAPPHHRHGLAPQFRPRPDAAPDREADPAHRLRG